MWVLLRQCGCCCHSVDVSATVCVAALVWVLLPYCGCCCHSVGVAAAVWVLLPQCGCFCHNLCCCLSVGVAAIVWVLLLQCGCCCHSVGVAAIVWVLQLKWLPKLHVTHQIIFSAELLNCCHLYPLELAICQCCSSVMAVSQ